MSWKRLAAAALAKAGSGLGVTGKLRTCRRARRDFRAFILEYHAVAAQEKGKAWFPRRVSAST